MSPLIAPDFALARYGERLYAQQDANWNVTSISNAAGAVQERYLYDPYGAVSYKTPTWGSRSSSSFSWVYLHQGGRYDNSSKLYHFRNRDYSPTLGRWTRVDPMGYVDGSNLYLAYLSNPVHNIDSSGLSSFADLLIGTGIGTALRATYEAFSQQALVCSEVFLVTLATTYNAILEDYLMEAGFGGADDIAEAYWDSWTNFLGEGPEFHSRSGNGVDFGPTLGMGPGQHHFDPRGWGDRVPYKDPSLPYLNKQDHTWIHKKWSDFLDRRTGKRYQSQSGRDWRSEKTPVERKQLVDDFLADLDADPKAQKRFQSITQHPRNRKVFGQYTSWRQMILPQRIRAAQIARAAPMVRAR